MWVAHSWKNSKRVAMLPITNTDCRTTERSTSDSLGDVSWIQKAALQLYRRNGMCHSSTCPGTSFHMTQFYQAFPTLVLQATDAGVRRPGYEATTLLRTYFCYCCWSAQGAILYLPHTQVLSQYIPVLYSTEPEGHSPVGEGHTVCYCHAISSIYPKGVGMLIVT